MLDMVSDGAQQIARQQGQTWIRSNTIDGIWNTQLEFYTHEHALCDKNLYSFEGVYILYLNRGLIMCPQLFKLHCYNLELLNQTDYILLPIGHWVASPIKSLGSHSLIIISCGKTHTQHNITPTTIWIYTIIYIYNLIARPLINLFGCFLGLNCDDWLRATRQEIARLRFFFNLLARGCDFHSIYVIYVITTALWGGKTLLQRRQPR